MPIYEYKCQSCGHSFEQLQKATDELLCTCPECGKKQLKKLMSNTSFQLKGTGWYVTDFKNKKETASSKPKTEKKTTETRDKPKAGEKPKNTEDK
ncbi:CxxC_CXXC_SSSS domain-containing protein [Gammaproteobacteria bacterium]